MKGLLTITRKTSHLQLHSTLYLHIHIIYLLSRYPYTCGLVIMEMMCVPIMHLHVLWYMISLRATRIALFTLQVFVVLRVIFIDAITTMKLNGFTLQISLNASIFPYM